MTIGERLRQLRQANKLTLQDLSRLSTVSVPFLSEIETGKCTPSIDTVEKIAEAYDIPLSLLFKSVGKGAKEDARREPRSFVEFRTDPEFKEELNPEWKRLLLSINLFGVRPKQKRDYISLYLLLRRILVR
ncbi:MAG: helix-turn-helix transcriptional regulator [Gammaproteobacteria bacterium]|nr:helix-turn-helix transcriptional regulator [Gammaproteobacteria bacterium]